MVGRLKWVAVGALAIGILIALWPAPPSAAVAPTADGQCVLFAPADVSTNDRFGSSIGIDGDSMAVGAWLSDPEEAVDAGAVYMYELGSDGDWAEGQKIVASTPQVGAGFGFSVDLDGDILAVGAYDEAIDVQNAGGIETVLSAGAVYIFERQADGRWQEQNRLTADQPGAEEFFGHNLEVDADTQSVVVGVPGHDVVDPPAEDAGAAYVFSRDERGAWSRQAVLVDPNAQPGDRAGNDVGISGDRVVVGHHLDDQSGGATLSNAGGALIYSRVESADGPVWGGPVELDGSEARQRDRAGVGVDIDGNVLVMTGWAQQPGDRAVAWIFERDGADDDAQWIEQARLEPEPVSVEGSHFGRHVELSGSVLAIGASLDDRAAVDGGAVYYYARTGGQWDATATVSPAAITENAHAGIALATSAEWATMAAERVALGAVNSGGACVTPLAAIVDVGALDLPATPDPVLASEGVPALVDSGDAGRGARSRIPRRLSSTRGIVVIGGAAAALIIGAGVFTARRRA